jgi:FMN-dependent NADH-azoreductase
MKQENEDSFVVKIPQLAHEQLEELRKATYPKQTKGQAAAVAINEKYRQTIAKEDKC